jgi:hypothetical protein
LLRADERVALPVARLEKAKNPPAHLLASYVQIKHHLLAELMIVHIYLVKILKQEL